MDLQRIILSLKTKPPKPVDKETFREATNARGRESEDLVGNLEQDLDPADGDVIEEAICKLHLNQFRWVKVSENLATYPITCVHTPCLHPIIHININ